MTSYAWWWIAALGLVIVELMTGTFYVLMIAIAAVAGGGAAWFGLQSATQFVTAAIVGVVAVAVLRRSGAGAIERKRDPAVDPMQMLDIGQTVHVREWRDGVARVMHRGAQWDAVLLPGEPETIGALYIRELRGTRLVLSSQRA